MYTSTRTVVERLYQADKRINVGLVNPTYLIIPFSRFRTKFGMTDMLPPRPFMGEGRGEGCYARRFATNCLNPTSAFQDNRFRNEFGMTHNKAAFTLAEVLITLGIIGVVAALTIPGLIAKFHQIQFETAFKKEYSMFQNAMNLITEEENLLLCYTHYPKGTSSYATVSDDCKQLEKNLVQALKLSEYKSGNKLISKYASKSKVLANGGKTVNNACSYEGLGVFNSYVALDGTIYNFKFNNFPVLIIDVNGERGPNKWGYDVFFMVLSNHKDKLLLTDEYCSIVEKGGQLPRNILKNKKTTTSSDFTIRW